MIFYASIICSLVLSIIGYFGFDWMMRYSKVDFIKFPIKAQRLVCASIGIIFVIPIVLIRVIAPEIDDLYWYLLMAAGVMFIIYSSILSFVSRRVLKKREIKEKIITLGLENSTDILHIKNELKSWDDISISTKQIEKILEQIQNEKNLKK